jgi:hypothetical protein
MSWLHIVIVVVFDDACADLLTQRVVGETDRADVVRGGGAAGRDRRGEAGASGTQQRAIAFETRPCGTASI